MLFVCNDELVKECYWLRRNNKNDEQIQRIVWFEPFECKIKSEKKQKRSVVWSFTSTIQRVLGSFLTLSHSFSHTLTHSCIAFITFHLYSTITLILSSSCFFHSFFDCHTFQLVLVALSLTHTLTLSLFSMCMFLCVSVCACGNSPWESKEKRSSQIGACPKN